MSAREAYERGKAERAREVLGHEARAGAIAWARFAVFVGVLGLVGAIVWAPLPSTAWIGVVVLLLVFAALVIIHARVIAKKDAAAAALGFHERGLRRLDGKWSESPQTGERFRSADHPFAHDLDVFGRASLFQLLDATETRFGEERLASLLSSTDLRGFPGDVRARQDAVRDLAPRVAFRERLAVQGALLGATKPDPAPFLAWAEGSIPLPHGTALLVLVRSVPVLLVAGIAVGASLGYGMQAFIGAVVLGLAVTLLVRGNVGKIASVVSSRETGLLRYGELFRAIEAEGLAAPLLASLKARLQAEGASATAHMTSLARILSFLDARNNEVFRIFIGPVLLWDVNCVLSLERWRLRAGASVRRWFDVLGEIEALASLAGFAFDRPDHVFPELVADAVLDARALGHPLLPEGRRVDNDVAFDGPGQGLIVTGSNMSGKSTLLRAVGVNAVLALAGGPVCARALRVGPLEVVTSMRVSDSLEEGVSHFYAELQKLKRVIDRARARAGERKAEHASGGPAVLFLLDEILHGTNSRERILGARAILRELLLLGATGAVSTHDLGISDLEASLAAEGPGAAGVRPVARNVHFEEQVEGDTMTFDYRLRPGIVQSSNALRLMKIVGIDVT